LIIFKDIPSYSSEMTYYVLAGTLNLAHSALVNFCSRPTVDTARHCTQ